MCYPMEHKTAKIWPRCEKKNVHRHCLRLSFHAVYGIYIQATVV